MYSVMDYFTLFLLLFCQLANAQEFDPLSDAFIDYLNKQGKWKAGRNFHPDTPMSYIKNLMGLKVDDSSLHRLPKMEHDQAFIASLPQSFDAREKWPNCPSLNEIRDQGSCGSCWAFGAVEAMTDRVCIYSNGSQHFHFSAEDLNNCAGTLVGSCEGGNMYPVWDYWVNTGIVSGGNYGSKEGCKPYSIPKCEHHTHGKLPDCTKAVPTPTCVDQCESGYNVPYAKDKRRGKRAYFLEGEDNIKAELFKNGPVEIAYRVYADFLNYKGSVYYHHSGKCLGNHAVKLLGWGEEDGMKYWLVANSWNTHFGLNGFFKIRRGVDECNIESMGVVAGEPVL